MLASRIKMGKASPHVPKRHPTGAAPVPIAALRSRVVASAGAPGVHLRRLECDHFAGC
jgi:hypothetical protein